MKKIRFLLIYLFALAVLVACNDDVELEDWETEIKQDYIEVIEQNLEDNVDTPAIAQIEHLQLTPEDFWYDFEFLTQILEDNFPFFGVIERRTGISNPLETFINHGLPEDENLHLTFIPRINSGFRMFGNIAHLDLNPWWHWRSIWNTTLSSPLPYISDSSSDTLPLSLFHAFNPHRTSSRIIEEGRIALIMTPLEFFDYERIPPRAMQEIQDFIREIQGYEHVIIDSRHIGGGFYRNFINTFISPNISEPLSFYEFAFITDGERAQQTHSNLYFARPRTLDLLFLRNVTTPLVPAELFAEQHNLINMDTDDLENLAYGFLLETFVHPTSGSLRLPLLADNIWLLIGPRNGSAGEISGRIAKEAGFTLVGQQASNRNSWGRIYFPLPRTGYIVSMDTFYVTDSTGRNIEEFPLEPHYFGSDALHTVLEIIAERSE